MKREEIVKDIKDLLRRYRADGGKATSRAPFGLHDFARHLTERRPDIAAHIQRHYHMQVYKFVETYCSPD